MNPYPNATSLLLAAPHAQLLRMRRVIAHITRSDWHEAASLLALAARDAPNTEFGAECQALALQILPVGDATPLDVETIYL